MSTTCRHMACRGRRPLRLPAAIRRPDGWKVAAVAMAVLVLIPLLALFRAFLTPETDIWRHIAEHLLGELLLNTSLLATGVLAASAVLGVSLAWLTAACEFPGRRMFSWALLMPMAIPAYVLAFVFLGIFDFAGPVQSALRSWYPGRFGAVDVRSAPGVILVLSLCLYPYVYLLARGAFLTQGQKAMEAARSLGCRPLRAFFRVSLPMARPWIAGGLMLVLMETLADFGAVSVFNFNTFTTAIYKAWFGLFSLEAAAQLSSLLVVLAMAVMVLEQRTRRRMRFFQAGRLTMAGHRFRLRGARAWSATLLCGGVFLAGFGLPFLQLAAWSLAGLRGRAGAAYLDEMINSLVLSAGGATLIGAAALVLAYAARRHSDPFTAVASRIATVGYALPGTVLAVGLFGGLTAVDRVLADGLGLGPFLQGSLAMLWLAYGVRFLAVGYQPTTSAMLRITPSIDEAARSFGVRGWRLLLRIHVPMLRSGILTALLLGFVDIMKEMPMTLMTRPFGWDTLAVKIYELTSEGEWERAALPSVVLVLCGLVPVVLLVLKSEKRIP